MLSPMQIQRMCISYYVADYEVRPRSINSHQIAYSRVCRIPSHPRSCALLPRASSQTTATTTYCSPKQRRWDHTSSRSRAMSLAWRRTSRRTSTYRTCAASPHSSRDKGFSIRWSCHRLPYTCCRCCRRIDTGLNFGYLRGGL